MNPRAVALSVLNQLDATPRHLQTVLEAELGRFLDAPPRDRALTTNLVYTVLRWRLRLDHLLSPFCRRPLEALQPEVLNILRLGAAELTQLGTPPHAVVMSAVDQAKAARRSAASGLVNAVLRALSRGWREVAFPPPQPDPAAHLSLTLSHPRWLVEELLAALSFEDTQAWLEANQRPAALALRVNTLATTPGELASLLAPHAQAVTPHPLCSDSLVLAGTSGNPAALPGFAEGLWQAQDPAASAVTTLLGVEPGQRVLDMCAGVGGKTGLLAALMKNQGRLLAVDNSPGRVKALKTNLARLGVTNAQTWEADALALDSHTGPFDAILLDAPCSGLGTVGRRPDLRWRRAPEDPPRLAALQLALCEKAADLLAPGGALLYVTCTITRAENEGVVQALLARRPGMRIEWGLAAAGPAGIAIGDDGFWRTLPPRHACDAFFAARLIKG